MNLSKYSDYFHDGTLLNFKHLGNSLEVSMVSAEIAPEYMSDGMPPLHNKRITGKLYLEGIITININDKPCTGKLKKIYDSGSILDFEILDHKVILDVEWTDYPPKPRRSDFSAIEIEAERIHWENVSGFQVD